MAPMRKKVHMMLIWELKSKFQLSVVSMKMETEWVGKYFQAQRCP